MTTSRTGRADRTPQRARTVAAMTALVVLTAVVAALGPGAPAGAISDTQTNAGANVTCSSNGLHQGTGPVSTCAPIDITTTVLVNGANVATNTALAVGDTITVDVSVPPRGGHDAMYQETVDGIRTNQYDIEARIPVGLPSQTGTLLSSPGAVTMSRTDSGDRGSGPAVNCALQSGQDAARSDAPKAITLGTGTFGLTKMRADLAGAVVTGRWTELAADRCVNVLSNNGYYAGFTFSFTQTVLSKGLTAATPTWTFGRVLMARTDGSRSITWGADRTASLTLPANPALTAPGAPTIGAVVAGDGSAQVSWTAPASNGGTPITGYTVTPYVGATAQTPRPFASTATSQTITGLANGTTYTFKVAATNLVGTGAASVASEPVTPEASTTVPGPPTIGTATPGNAKVTLSWTAPTNNGGAPINGYIVTPFVGAVPQTARAYASTATTQTFIGLVNGTTYTFRVAAANVLGAGALSGPSNAVTPRSPWAPFATADAFTTRQFLDHAGRSPSSAELVQWRTAMEGSTSAASLIDGLRGSAYWEGQLGSLVRLYTAVYLRNPDTAGLTYWEGRLRGGQSLVSIAAFFASSQEFKTRYGTLGDAAFITLVYQNVLARDPDEAGFDFWTAELARGVSRGKLVLQFSNSNEYKAKTADQIDVITAWWGMLDRVPTTSEMTNALAVVTGPGSILDVISTLLATPEYLARVT